MPSDDTRIYVGNLPPDIRTRDVEDLFYKFGKINYIDLKNNKGPPFAFVEFDDPRDAEDAVSARDNYNYDGYTLRCEFPRGDRGGDREDGRGYRSYRGGGGGFRGGRGGFPSSRYVPGKIRPGPPSRRTDYRVLVSGLPPTGSWQDLKDHMREAGDVCFTDVNKDGTGIVEFLRYDDMKYAVKKLDDSKFRSHENETTYIRVKEDFGGKSSSSRRSRSRSPYGESSRARRGSPSYSPMRHSKSRSKSP